MASKDIKRDTTKNSERIASALLVAGSIPLGLLPGPNAAAAVAVGSAVNMTKRNMVDSKKYSVKQKTSAQTKASKQAQKKIKALEKSRDLFIERNKPQPGHVNMVYDEALKNFDREIKKYQKQL